MGSQLLVWVATQDLKMIWGEGGGRGGVDLVLCVFKL